MGKVIVIDGLDGSGKYTQSVLLAAYLSFELGIENVKHVSFPVYDSKTGQIVKDYLKGEIKTGNTFDDKKRLGMLYSFDRMYNVFLQRDEMGKTLMDYYNEDYILIFDRYTSSNYLYMTDGMDYNTFYRYVTMMEHIEYNIMGLPAPDLSIFLKMTPDKSLELIEQRGEEKDLHETREVLVKAYNALETYTEIAYEKNAMMGKTQTVVLDCLDESMELYSVDDISERIKNILLNQTDMLK